MMRIVEVMQDAADHHWAMAAFNAPGFDAMLAIARASAQAGLPAIIQTSAKLVVSDSAPALKAQFDLARSLTGAELFLHLDHCSDEALIGDCITAGWDMVMFDGSHLPLDENVARTRAITVQAHAAHTAVEAEVGPVGGEEDGIDHVANYASTNDITAICADTGIDCLAVGFGNVHGDYADKSLLNWDIFEGAQALAKRPLVLHGGSGLSDAEFKRAIAAGAAKVNISTDLKKVYHATMADAELAQTVLKSPGRLHDVLRQRLQEAAYHYIILFGKET